MPATKSKPTQPNEIRITRIYDAPVKMVWDAWTDPDQVVQWWGPRGFTHTTHAKDIRTGGSWDYTMHGPDGKDWPNLTYYHEVVQYSRLVYDHGGSRSTPPLFRVTAIFSEVAGNKTELEMTMAFIDEAKAKEMAKFIKQAGGNATWDRLGEYLAKKTEDKEVFYIHRSFNVPMKTMFEMWSNPKHVEKWMPPTGMNMKFIRADIREGGSSFYMMSNPEETFKMFGRAHYKQIKSPDRMVYSQEFVDENEKIARHPGAPTWPESMLTTITLTEEGPSQTRVTIRWEPAGNVTAAELAAFIKEKPGMTMGWTGSLDKLEDYIKA